MIKAEQKPQPALKSMVSGFLLNRREERNASAPARSTAASPPYNNRVRKIKVSEMEIWELKRGIGMMIRELMRSVIPTMIAKRVSRRSTLRRRAQKTAINTPAAITAET